MYGKIISGKMIHAPSAIRHNGRTYINPNASILEAEGYVKLTFSPCPAADDGYCYRENWTDDGVQHWELVEDTSDHARIKSVETRTDTLEQTTDDVILMMAELIGG